VLVKGARPFVPMEVRNYRLSLETVPSHGIIEPLRLRSGESSFAGLPDAPFSVVVSTTSGRERYEVTKSATTALLRVCNEPRAQYSSSRD